MFETMTLWRVADLWVGRIIYCPPHQRVDPETRQGTGELQKFRVKSNDGKAAALEIYRGDEPAEMPPPRED